MRGAWRSHNKRQETAEGLLQLDKEMRGQKAFSPPEQSSIGSSGKGSLVGADTLHAQGNALPCPQGLLRLLKTIPSASNNTSLRSSSSKQSELQREWWYCNSSSDQQHWKQHQVTDAWSAVQWWWWARWYSYSSIGGGGGGDEDEEEEDEEEVDEEVRTTHSSSKVTRKINKGEIAELRNDEAGADLLETVVEAGEKLSVSEGGADEDEELVPCGLDALQALPRALRVLDNVLQGAAAVDGVEGSLLAAAQPDGEWEAARNRISNENSAVRDNKPDDGDERW